MCVCVCVCVCVCKITDKPSIPAYLTRSVVFIVLQVQ